MPHFFILVNVSIVTCLVAQKQ